MISINILKVLNKQPTNNFGRLLLCNSNCNSFYNQLHLINNSSNNLFKTTNQFYCKRYNSTSSRNGNDESSHTEYNRNENHSKSSSGGQLPTKLFIGTGAILALISVVFSKVWEDTNEPYSTNDEFQKDFNKLMKWIEQEIEQNGFDTFSADSDKEFNDSKNPFANILRRLVITLETSNIGHSQPETIENIQRIISLLTEKIKNTDQWHSYYYYLICCLNELVYDCNQMERVIPMLTKLVGQQKYANFEMKFVTREFERIAKEKKYSQLLAENNAVTVECIHRHNEMPFANSPFGYIYAINEIVNNVNEDTDPNISDKEKQLIKLCRQDKDHSFWANRRNMYLLNMGISLLVSLPIYKYPPTKIISIPSLIGFGVFYGVHNFVIRDSSNSLFIKGDSPTSRTISTILTPLTCLFTFYSFIKFPVLFKPVIGYFIGHKLIDYQYTKLKPYDNINKK